MVPSVRLYSEVYIVKPDHGLDTRKHRDYTEPNINLYTGIYDHPLCSRHAKLGSRN